ncbi:glycoside hydrolase family 43 protein [Cylindrobasidium torrendii FP15055 ss-10]|uniref:arabinan endo-1,5-alpha-L-arabinosidase n=1 Tax=Cylindrobasidium torrendii FP15055 ss-10 TaxID=1314674 RepID=A0A0D7AZH6_9AGAR|nr:glycoside hydrolase family 43 protein [Cylindrobasidium torrendii FP15055 ss-10]
MAVLSKLLSVVSAAASVYAYVGPGAVTGDTATHDPTMCKDASGTYFLFATAPGISITTSTDRTAFTSLGLVFPDGSATWTDEYTLTSNGNLWAPECYHDGSQFWLWYAASSFGSQNSAIFLAKSSTGQPGDWTNEGVVYTSQDGDSYNAIDPNLFIDGSTWYMSFGSFWQGIALTTLDSTGVATGSVSNIAKRPSNGGAVEASSIFKNGDFYYLFTSWDKCCSGTSSTYNIRVGRSSSISGPYVDSDGVALTAGGGTLVLETHDAITGPGGQDVYEDGDGPILVYHYYNSDGSFLGLNRLDFSSGWPVVA